MIFEPSTQGSIGIDYWSIRRRNSISALGDTTVFDTFAAADPLTAQGRFVRYPRVANGSCQNDLPGLPTPANVPCAVQYTVQVQENLGKFNVTGVDLTSTYRFMPSLTFRFDGTYVISYRYQKEIDGAYFDNVGRFSSDNGVIPRWKHYATINWRTGPVGVTLAQNYMLGYRDSSAKRRVATYETYDLQGTWDAWRGLGVTLGVKNVLDRDPPASDQGQTFQVGYDPRYTDAHGRTLYLGLKYAFK
jgi:iron complex outermembrane receptor protein